MSYKICQIIKLYAASSYCQFFLKDTGWIGKYGGIFKPLAIANVDGTLLIKSFNLENSIIWISKGNSFLAFD